MQPRLASILAQILASSALVACGGKTSEVPSVDENNPTSSSSSGGTGTGTSGPERPRRDAGGPEDAGCRSKPVLVKSEGPTCADVWQHPCGYPAGVDPEDGLSSDECEKVCPSVGTGSRYWGCNVYQQDDVPGPAVECYTCVEGRRPQGYLDRPLERTVAGWLAHAADLERVSIDAFQILARELAHHGAPRRLIEAAKQAESDEVRHAHVLEALARREGAAPHGDPVVHGAVRALVDVALENAVEGCVRETYGALVAGHQALHAQRIDIRRVMKRVYADESMHAELAWDVHAWIMPKLTAAERARVEASMADAAAQLARGAELAWPHELASALGLPPPARATRLVRDLTSRVFAPALVA